MISELRSYVSFPDGIAPFSDRHQLKIISICVCAAIAFCLFVSREGIMKNFEPFMDNPLLSMRNLGIWFVIGLAVMFVWILISKLIDRAGLGDDLRGQPYDY